MESMDYEMKDVEESPTDSSCVLQPTCGKHHGRCPNPWVMVPQVHDFLHQFHGELQRTIIAGAVVPRHECIKHVFGHCYDRWACQDGAHLDHSAALFDAGTPPCTPSVCYTSRCGLVREEGYKTFFLHNLFIFKSRSSIQATPAVFSGDEAIREWYRTINSVSIQDRDHRATRLLDFIDAPYFRGRGSVEFQRKVILASDRSYDDVDLYRYMIRHMVLLLNEERMQLSSLAFRYNWAWALTVDWKTLPNLQTLVLDLRGYSYRQLQVEEIPQELYDEQLESGAKRMECLELKTLIIYGLCSGREYWGKAQHRRRMEKLFGSALGKWGILELRDEENYVDW